MMSDKIKKKLLILLMSFVTYLISPLVLLSLMFIGPVGLVFYMIWYFIIHIFIQTWIKEYNNELDKSLSIFEHIKECLNDWWN